MLDDSSSSNSSIDFVVIRFDHTRRNYEIKSIYELTFEHSFTASPGSSLECQYVDANEERFPTKKGDIFGFVGRGTSPVALAVLPEERNSTLRVYESISDNGTTREDNGLLLSVGDSVQVEEMDTQQYIALIRIIISEFDYVYYTF